MKNFLYALIIFIGSNYGVQIFAQCNVNGGHLSGGPFQFCVEDGVSDNIEIGSIHLQGNRGPNSQWVVTDEDGNILGLPPMPDVVNFDGAGFGTSRHCIS